MENFVSPPFNRPITIGNRVIENRLALAPLTKLGNVAFRELLSEYGGYGLLFSEMCGARRLPHENRRTSPIFRWRDEEIGKLSWQIVGTDPSDMADAARRIENEGFFGVDINFGCSVAAICRHSGGAALLKQPDTATRIVSAVRKAVSIPVTVKFRTGWQDDPLPAVRLARRFESAGADALTFHPRVAPDRRSRPPRWEYIGKVKDAVTIPVFGNGDVFTLADGDRMMEQTGCDGIALGRIAVAKPWIFAEWMGTHQPEPDCYKKVVFRLIKLLERHFDPQRALGRFKKFAFYFSANFRFGHTLYSGIQNAPDLETAKAAAEKFFLHPPSVTTHPNRNFFT